MSEKRPSRLTLPFDSPDSHRLIGRIVSQAKRPVPEWVTLLMSAGTAEPVNISCPGFPLRLTTNLAASQSCGASCHSSINLGVSPCSKNSGSFSASIKLERIVLGLSMYKTLAAMFSAVVVFPHHFAPWISTTPADSNCSFNSLSATLFLYFSIISTIDFLRCKDNAFYLIFSVFKISFRQLEHFQSVSWRFFILPVGEFLSRQLEDS